MKITRDDNLWIKITREDTALSSISIASQSVESNLLFAILEKIEAKNRFAEGFKAGQLSVKRRNKSGCACIINDRDEVVVACGAHLNWRDSFLVKDSEE